MTKQDADDKSPLIGLYTALLTDIKTRIRQAQIKATLSANAEMILLYWDIGRMIKGRKAEEGWGKGLLRRLATDLKNEVPEIKGFSERNLQLMIQFHEEYPELPGLPPSAEIRPQAAAQSSPSQIVQRLVAQISWAHNILLKEKE